MGRIVGVGKARGAARGGSPRETRNAAQTDKAGQAQLAQLLAASASRTGAGALRT